MSDAPHDLQPPPALCYPPPAPHLHAQVLRINNIALIPSLELELGDGLTLLTGETGAGKSILIDALGLLLGERASAELIRTGEERAIVEGVFEVPEPGPSSRAMGSPSKTTRSWCAARSWPAARARRR